MSIDSISKFAVSFVLSSCIDTVCRGRFFVVSESRMSSSIDEKNTDLKEDAESKADTATSSGKQDGKQRKKKSAGRYAAEFFIKIAVTALVVWILLSFVFGIYVVHDNRSYPMLKDGDLCLILRPAELRSGDAVVYTSGGKIRFGRIAAMPGETVDIGDEGLMVNGYNVFEDTVYPTGAEGAETVFPYTVPEGMYFILNDYRPDISDSRTFGAVSKKNIKGRIIFIMRRRGI